MLLVGVLCCIACEGIEVVCCGAVSLFSKDSTCDDESEMVVWVVVETLGNPQLKHNSGGSTVHKLWSRKLN